MDCCRICNIRRVSNLPGEFLDICDTVVHGMTVDRLISCLLGGPVACYGGVGPKFVCKNCFSRLVEMHHFRDMYRQNIADHYHGHNMFLPPRPTVYPGVQSSSGYFGESSAHMHSVMHSHNSGRDSSSSTDNSDPFYTSYSSYTGVMFQSNSGIAGSNNANLLSSSAESSMQNIDSSIHPRNHVGSSNVVDVSNPAESSIQIADSSNEGERQGVVIVNQDSPIIIDSDDDADNDCFIIDGKKTSNNDELYYCSICETEMVNNHNCFLQNKEFCTCLVPNCSMLFRSFEDFKSHYYKHMGILSTAKLCLVCYREETNDHHHQNVANLYKCYSCQITLDNLQSFVDHKLKKHKGRLVSSSMKYLCFYCETEFVDIMLANKHIENCREDQEKKSTDTNQKFYTCTKYSCNNIFTNFSDFKDHYYKHFRISNNILMCWQCFRQFKTVESLQVHQRQGVCCTPGMFKCKNCSSKFDELHSLSIHKLTSHDGVLKSTKKFMICPSCKTRISVDNLKNHITACK